MNTCCARPNAWISYLGTLNNYMKMVLLLSYLTGEEVNLRGGVTCLNPLDLGSGVGIRIHSLGFLLCPNHSAFLAQVEATSSRKPSLTYFQPHAWTS